MTNDILINLDTMDVEAKDGDFAVGDATKQNQKIILLCNKGEIKLHPTICVGALSHLDDETVDDLLREIRKEYVNDGMEVNSINKPGDTIIVDAVYK